MGSKSNRSRRYTEEFKRDAVALVRSSGKTVTEVGEVQHHWDCLTPLETRHRHEQEHALTA